MRKPALRGLAGATIAVGAFAAALAVPSRLGEGPRTIAASEHVPLACVAPRCEPGPAGLVDRVDGELVARLPQLDAFERRLLARTIVAESELARIDPFLVLALIEVESSFDVDALSGRGAMGLMQLRAPTFRRELERAGLAPNYPNDPVANVQAGVRYLRRLLDAFGREEIALMAYNAGPNRILGYLRDGEIPPRFHVYPRRVKAELRRLRRTAGEALVVADAR
ncbi:MAG TPA: lytic transglycosylase domain-containing protein [Anaeromyxobacter sp.]|nr:lytic transglycosylase domain-containing protein [Anaeromyxobacter sp.]